MQRIPRKLKKALKAYMAKRFPAEYGNPKHVRVSILYAHNGVCGARWRVDRTCMFLTAYNTFVWFRKKSFEYGDGIFLSGEELERIDLSVKKSVTT